MNANELYLNDGRPTGVYFCSVCRSTYRDKEPAEECCSLHKKCVGCGDLIPKKSPKIACPDCVNKKRDARERERFNKAAKVSEWDGMIYSEGHGPEYFQDMDELIEWIDDASFPDNPLGVPEYVWTCDEHRVVDIDVSVIVNHIRDSEFASDDFDEKDLNGLDELQGAIIKFNSLNAGFITYTPNYNLALILKKESHDIKHEPFED